jgi:hypothetical protein
MHISPSETYAAAEAQANNLASAVLALSGAILVKMRIVYKADLKDASLVADAPTIKQTGVFIFSTEDDNPYAVVEVPGLKDSVLVTTGPGAGVDIDTGNPDAADFIAIVEDGIYCSPFGDDIATIVTAYLQSRV